METLGRDELISGIMTLTNLCLVRRLMNIVLHISCEHRWASCFVALFSVTLPSFVRHFVVTRGLYFPPGAPLELSLVMQFYSATSGKGHLALAVFRCFSCPRAS